MNSKLNILVVDDEIELRESIVDYIETLNHNVFEAENGKEALDIISNNKINIIFTDINMPIINGLDLLKIISEKKLDIYSVVISGSNELTKVIDAFKFGAYSFFTKPFNLFKVKITIQNILKKINLKKQLKEQEKEIFENKKLQGLGLIAVGIMHEINNPNTFIKGNADFLKRKIMPIIKNLTSNSEFDEKLQRKLNYFDESIEGIIKGSKRISKIAKRLSSFLHFKNKEENVYVDLIKYLNKTLTLLNNEFVTRNNTTLNIDFNDINENQIFIEGFKEEIIRIFYNLSWTSKKMVKNA